MDFLSCRDTEMRYCEKRKYTLQSMGDGTNYIIIS